MTAKELKAKYPDLADMFRQVKDGRHIHISRKLIRDMWLNTTYQPTEKEVEFYQYVSRALREGATAVEVKIMPSAEKRGAHIDKAEIKLNDSSLGNPGAPAPQSFTDELNALRNTVNELKQNPAEAGSSVVEALKEQMLKLQQQNEIDRLKAEHQRTVDMLNRDIENLETENKELTDIITTGKAQLAGLEEKNKTFTEKWGNILGAAGATAIERAFQKNPWILTGIGIDEEVVKENLFPKQELGDGKTETQQQQQPAQPQPAQPKPKADDFAGLEAEHRDTLKLLIAACKMMTAEQFKQFMAVALFMFDGEGKFLPEAAADIFTVLKNESESRAAADAAAAAAATPEPATT